MAISKPVMAVIATDRKDAVLTTVLRITTVEPGDAEPELQDDGTFKLVSTTPSNTGHIMARAISSGTNGQDTLAVNLKIWDGTEWQTGILTGS